MTKEQKDKALSALADGKGVLMNCNFGFGITVREMEDGRAAIEVNPNPLEGFWCYPPCEPVALKEFMEKTAVGWLKAVAPHRLNYGSDYA